MSVKYSPTFLNKLENLFAESDYILRYEKGNFKAGYCILKTRKVVVVNKYFTTEGKINCLIEILSSLKIDTSNFTPKSLELYSEMHQTKLSL